MFHGALSHHADSKQSKNHKQRLKTKQSKQQKAKTKHTHTNTHTHTHTAKSISKNLKTRQSKRHTHARTHTHAHTRTHTHIWTKKKGRQGQFLAAFSTTQQHASASQGWIFRDNCTCCLSEIQVADQTCYPIQSQHTDVKPTSPSIDTVMPGTPQGSH